VLTTNFDDLVEQACRGNPAALTTTIRSPEEAKNISTAPGYAQIVFLHGTVDHYTDLNLASETQQLAPELVAALSPLLRDHPLVVIGYRGAEQTIMQDLLIKPAKSNNLYRHGIYWCRHANSPLHPFVCELRDRIGSNFLLVDIPGFDEALSYLKQGVGRSARAQLVAPDGPLPSPELAPSQSGLDELDWLQVEAKLRLCAKRLDLGDANARADFEQTLLKLHLASEQDGVLRPTQAGLRLFGKKGTTAVILRWASGEQTFRGNIFAVLEQTREALAELNAPFRLKGPVSEDVRPFEPLALKELLVNALVHRDYEVDSAVSIVVTENQVTFRSPGGVIDTVDRDRLGKPGVKGYRNQVLANVLYGTGDMDKLGSGLVDVRRWAQEIGADATFTVDGANTTFVARMLARPERPLAPGSPAQPTGSYQVFYANALPVRIPRAVVDVGPCRAASRRAIWEQHAGVATAPFVLDGQSLVTLDDLRSPQNALRQSCWGDPETFGMEEFCSLPEGQKQVVQLLNESLGRHAKDLGFVVDWKEHRLWYPKASDGDGAVDVTYRGRVKQSTRRVVKVRQSADGRVLYYEHAALQWQFRRLDGEWYLFLLPGWAFTSDGEQTHLPPRRVTSLSTRRAARDYNASVSAHLFFWAYVLTGGQPEVVLRDGGGVVVLGSSLLTAHMAGMPPTPGSGEPYDDDVELDELPDEDSEDLEEESD
jgi:Putative ATP-dependent DNA helicase recG C-terminal/SIR2-like domain